MTSFTDNLPTHIAFIPDGNRRWAESQKQSLAPYAGHEAGVQKFEEVAGWCRDLKIPTVTIYALSTENVVRRDSAELSALYALFKTWCNKITKECLAEKHQARIRIIGDLDLLPAEVQSFARTLEADTGRYEQYTINIALAYGGRQEILHAAKRIAIAHVSGTIPDLAQVEEDHFRQYLWLPDEPDLVIRTGNRPRSSNFLLWQSAYSLFLVDDKLWPDFQKDDLECHIHTWQSTQINRGA